MNFRFPVFLDVTEKNCVVTGQGFEVPQKVEALVNASANVTYVNPIADERIARLAERGALHWERRTFVESDLDNCFLIRHPRDVILSFAKVVSDVAVEDTGFPGQLAIFSHLRQTTGKSPPA